MFLIDAYTKYLFSFLLTISHFPTATHVVTLVGSQNGKVFLLQRFLFQLNMFPFPGTEQKFGELITLLKSFPFIWQFSRKKFWNKKSASRPQNRTENIGPENPTPFTFPLLLAFQQPPHPIWPLFWACFMSSAELIVKKVPLKGPQIINYSPSNHQWTIELTGSVA